MEIFITKDGKESGPYSREQIDSLHLAGMLQLHDLVWHEGLNEWVALHRLLGVRPPPPGVLGEVIPSIDRGDGKNIRSASVLRGLILLLAMGAIGFGGWFGYQQWKARGILMVVNRDTWAVSDRSKVGDISYLESLLARQAAEETTEREDERIDRMYSTTLRMASNGESIRLAKGVKIRKIKDQDYCSMIRLEDDRTIGVYWIHKESLAEPR